MRFKFAAAFAIAALAFVASFGSSFRSVPVASADGPLGGVDPVAGTLLDTFTFVYTGFQANTPLTLSFLPPATPVFTILDTPVPVVTDGAGQAFVPIDILSLLGGDPSAALAASGYDPAQLQALASQITITWGYVPGDGVGSFRFDACDRLNCVDLVGTVHYNGP